MSRLPRQPGIIADFRMRELGGSKLIAAKLKQRGTGLTLDSLF